MDLNVPNWTCGKVQMNFFENRFNKLTYLIIDR